MLEADIYGGLRTAFGSICNAAWRARLLAYGVLLTAARELQRRGGRHAVVSACASASAAIIERT
jgi:hypothetical protein